MKQGRPIRVLCLDGGGMRGLYQATFLSTFAARIDGQPTASARDIGKAFDLIVGTSTGGLVAFALAAGKPLQDLRQLYFQHGAAIFPWQRARSIPYVQLLVRAFCRTNVSGDQALRRVLESTFQRETIGEMYSRRGIALAVPAVRLENDGPIVFKTPHLQRSNRRDDGRLIVDVCMATTAAPILRSIARIPEPGAPGTYASFADGGLWANNPSVMGITEAAELRSERGEQERPIHVFSLGTLPAQGGEMLNDETRHRGAWGWKFGLRALEAGINAQGDGYDYIARKFAELLGPGNFAVRLPSRPPPASLVERLQSMDDARRETLEALAQHAVGDVDLAWSQLTGSSPLQSFRDAILAAPMITSN